MAVWLAAVLSWPGLPTQGQGASEGPARPTAARLGITRGCPGASSVHMSLGMRGGGAVRDKTGIGPTPRSSATWRRPVPSSRLTPAVKRGRCTWISVDLGGGEGAAPSLPGRHCAFLQSRLPPLILDETLGAAVGPDCSKPISLVSSPVSQVLGQPLSPEPVSTWHSLGPRNWFHRGPEPRLCFMDPRGRRPSDAGGCGQPSLPSRGGRAPRRARCWRGPGPSS